MDGMVYEPRGAARDLLLDRSPEVAAVGAAGTGKTVGALMKLHITSLMVPKVQSLVVRQTHASLTASTLVAFEQFVAAKQIAAGEVKWFGGSGSKPAGYRYRNGSMIMVGGMDNPGKVLSMSLDRVLVDEGNQISVTAWETLLTRLRGTAGTYRQAVLALNPDHPEHWIKKRADDDGNPLHILTSRHTDNPSLFNRDGTPTASGLDYLARLDALTGIRRLRYRDGVWAAAEGRVFDDWRDDVHLIDAFDTAGMRSFWAIDWGYSNPLVFQRWVIDHDGRMYLTHEISRTKTMVVDLAKQVMDLSEANGWQMPEAIVCDHDAGDRAVFERQTGLATIAARKTVSTGVQAVQDRLRDAGDGKARLYVFRNAVCHRDPNADHDRRPRGFAAEVNGYVWATERGTDGQPKEVPLKQHDHSMDAGRYAVMYLDGAPAANIGNPAKPAPAVPSGTSPWSRPTGR